MNDVPKNVDGDLTFHDHSSSGQESVFLFWKAKFLCPSSRSFWVYHSHWGPIRRFSSDKRPHLSLVRNKLNKINYN